VEGRTLALLRKAFVEVEGALPRGKAPLLVEFDERFVEAVGLSARSASGPRVRSFLSLT
jgi:hypothetical protein